MKRTYQPSKRKKQSVNGFRARMATPLSQSELRRLLPLDLTDLRDLSSLSATLFMTETLINRARSFGLIIAQSIPSPKLLIPSTLALVRKVRLSQSPTTRRRRHSPRLAKRILTLHYRLQMSLMLISSSLKS